MGVAVQNPLQPSRAIAPVDPGETGAATPAPLSMIIDSHVHYIEPPTAQRPYDIAPIMAPISVDEVVAAATAAGVDRIVDVTPSTMGYDNRYAFEGARARPDRVLGVFGRVDPLLHDVQARLRDFWQDPVALGVRQTMFAARSRDWLRLRALDPFLRAAAALDVPVALFAPFQVDDARDTVDRHPDVRFLIDHTFIRHEPDQTVAQAFRHWPALIALAGRPNVWVKVSHFPEAALGVEAYPYPSAAAHLRSLVETVGPKRLIWGSNFPPVQRACSYRQTLAFFTEACHFLDAEDLEWILGRTFLEQFGRSSTGHSDGATPSSRVPQAEVGQ